MLHVPQHKCKSPRTTLRNQFSVCIIWLEILSLKKKKKKRWGGREESLVYMKSWAQFPVPHFVSVCVNSKSVSFYRTVKLVKWCAVYTLFQVYLESRRYSGTLTQQIQTLDLILNTKNTSSFSHEKITSKEWEI